MSIPRFSTFRIKPTFITFWWATTAFGIALDAVPQALEREARSGAEALMGAFAHVVGFADDFQSILDFADITARFENGEMNDLKNLRSYAAGMPLSRFNASINPRRMPSGR